MGSVKFFLRIFLLTFIVGIVIAVFVFSSGIRNTVLGTFNKETGSVKGISTKRAQKITSQIASDIGDGFDIAKKQVLNIKIGDALNYFSRLQKIPQDIQSGGQYVQEQMNSFINKKK